MYKKEQNTAPSGGCGDEREDLERARAGDLEAFDRLIRRYEDQVYSVALRLIGDRDDAADVTQEVFIACFRYLKDYRGNAKFSTWLHRITVNMVKNLWNRQKRQGRDKTFSLDLSEDPGKSAPVESLVDPAANPRRRAAASEIWGLLDRELREIEPSFREVIVLRFVEGLSYEEIAEATGESLGTVKSRIFRARRALKERMQPYLTEMRRSGNV